MTTRRCKAKPLAVAKAHAPLRSFETIDRRAGAAATKARVAQAGGFVTGQAVQLHGGIGVTEGYAVGHYFKRLLAFEQRHGSAAAQVARFAALSA